jgi:DNA-3-methyladenine glycosylase
LPICATLTDRLDRAFFTRSTVTVARDLLGCVLMRTAQGVTVSGRIVETEAYGDETDLASHAAVYQRTRIGIMRAEPGTVYVYRSYGVHYCFNIVAHNPGEAGAVLIRAVEPIAGVQTMAERRGVPVEGPLTNGPGKLGQAFALHMSDTGVDAVTSDEIYLLGGPRPAKLGASARIGITRDVDRLWRFFDESSGSLSRPVRSTKVRSDAC